MPGGWGARWRRATLPCSAVSDLWTQSTGVFISGRVLGVFCGQAIGANNKKLAGIWLQVSYVVLAAIALPVFALWALTGGCSRASAFRLDDPP